jgi:hypothetical protein
LGQKVNEDWKKMGGAGTLSYRLESGTFGDVQLDILAPAGKVATVAAAADVLGTFPLQFDTADSHKAENDAAVSKAIDLLKKEPASTARVEMFIAEANTEEEKKTTLRVATIVKKAMVSLGIGAARITANTAMGIAGNGTITVETQPAPAAASEASELISSFEVDYKPDASLETASAEKLKEQITKLKSNAVALKDKAEITVQIQVSYLTDAEKANAESVRSFLEKQFLEAGVQKENIKSDPLVTGRLRTALIQNFAKEIITVTSLTGTCCGPQIAPGHVLIIPIADLKSRNAVNPLQPKTGRRTLLEIENYLKKRTSPFVKVHAKNPLYEQVMVAFRVKFYTGTDKGFYLKKLNEEIVHFLTPWAFDETKEVEFGGEVYSSSIINFIEERPYVDFITDFFMFVCRDECCPPKEDARDGKDGRDGTVAEILSSFCSCKDFEELLQSDFNGLVVARPSTSRSILVSVPQHIIVPYTEPAPLSPCEKRAQAKNTRTKVAGNLAFEGRSNVSAAAGTPGQPMASFDKPRVAVKTVTKKPVKKSAVPVKKAAPAPKKKK